MKLLKCVVALCGLSFLGFAIGEKEITDSGRPERKYEKRSNSEKLNNIQQTSEWNLPRGYEGLETSIRKRSKSPIEFSRVDIIGPHRDKRRVAKISNVWTPVAPVYISPNYSAQGDWAVANLLTAFRKYSDSVCTRFDIINDKWNQSNPNWFVENGYERNSFLYVQAGYGCKSIYGYTTGQVDWTPCSEPELIFHETLHINGGEHSQRSPTSVQYLTVWPDNIQPIGMSEYSINTGPAIEEDFDPQTCIMYRPWMFSLNGLQTMSYMQDDLFESNVQYSRSTAILFELNTLMNCTERFCGNVNRNCGYGKYIRYKGVCQCVCCPDFDPATNCTKPVSGPNTVDSWPDMPFGVFAADATTPCPDGLNPGVFTFDGTYAAIQQPSQPSPLTTNGNTLTYKTCVKDVPPNSTCDWLDWVTGSSYCMLQGSGNNSCGRVGGAFKEYWINMKSEKPVNYSGSLGGVSISGNNITIKALCRSGEGDYYLDLPNRQAFRLLFMNTCPKIRGMKSFKMFVLHWTPSSSGNGTAGPWIYSYSNQLQIYHCLYLPLQYGCNQEIILTAQNKSATVSTPVNSMGRRPLTRCIYTLNVPAGSKTMVTFTRCDMDPDDSVSIKKYNKYKEFLQVNCSEVTQFITEKEFCMIDYQSGYKNVTTQGLTLRFDLKLPQDHVYNTATNGADYLGQHFFTETYEECLPWGAAVNCPSFPKKGMSKIWALQSQNCCRNLDGDKAQPFCYVYVNGSNCWIRYCDVNRFLDAKDSNASCPKLVQQDKAICNDSSQRLKCIKTCNVTIPSTARATCGAPTIPADGTQVSPTKTSYLQGERVYINCAANSSLPQSEMICNQTGWSTLTSACGGIGCQDSLSSPACEDLLYKYPDFCSDTKTNPTFYCKKTCGACPTNPNCTAPSSSTYSSVPANSVVKAGQAMNFTCANSTYLVSGNLRRACSSSGTLLGTEPVCQTTPPPTEVNSKQAILRVSTVPVNQAFLCTRDDMKVPFDGFVDAFYHYCVGNGFATFFFVRYNGTQYTFIGGFEINCISVNWKWITRLTSQQQIPVKKGDLLGIFTNKTTISCTECDGAMHILAKNPYVMSSTFSQVQQSMAFSGSTCLLPSVGYRVVPGGSYGNVTNKSAQINQVTTTSTQKTPATTTSTQKTPATTTSTQKTPATTTSTQKTPATTTSTQKTPATTTSTQKTPATTTSTRKTPATTTSTRKTPATTTSTQKTPATTTSSLLNHLLRLSSQG